MGRARSHNPDGATGLKRPTQVEVARRAGVSRATVSYVLNGLSNSRVPISDETRQRVMLAITELGYVPDASAQALRSGSTHTIGLIIPDMHNPHFWQTADGVEQAARAGGYHLLLSSTDLNPQVGQDVLRDLSRRRIDGLIVMGSIINRSEVAQSTLSELQARQLIIVEIADHLNTDYDFDCVWSDYREATEKLMSHLLSLGHRRIGLIYGVGAPDLGLDRLQPYQASLRAADLPLDPELVVECGTTIEAGYQGARQLLSRAAPPTAIIAINDLLAIGVLRAGSDLGLRVPADLSLASYDDIPAAQYLVPRLTTASKDAFRLGQEAVRLLLARLEDPGQSRQTQVVPVQVFFRESTGPVPAH
jgi:LacI family transcriptional regulator